MTADMDARRAGPYGNRASALGAARSAGRGRRDPARIDWMPANRHTLLRHDLLAPRRRRQRWGIPVTAAVPSLTLVGPDQTSGAVPGVVTVAFGRAAADQCTALSSAHALPLTVAIPRSDASSQMATLGTTSMSAICEELAPFSRQAVDMLHAAFERNDGELHTGHLPGAKPLPQAAPALATVDNATDPASIGHRSGSKSDWGYGS